MYLMFNKMSGAQTLILLCNKKCPSWHGGMQLLLLYNCCSAQSLKV